MLDYSVSKHRNTATPQLGHCLSRPAYMICVWVERKNVDKSPFQTHPTGSFRVAWLMDSLVGWLIDFPNLYWMLLMFSLDLQSLLPKKVTTYPDLELVRHCVVVVFWAVKWWVPTCDFATGQQASGFLHFFCWFCLRKRGVTATKTTRIIHSVFFVHDCIYTCTVENLEDILDNSVY